MSCSSFVEEVEKTQVVTPSKHPYSLNKLISDQRNIYTHCTQIRSIMKAILSLLLGGNAVFGHFMSLNDSVEATHQTVKALITEDRIQCKAQGLCPVITPSIKQFTPCEGGQAGGYACSNIDLLSFISLADLGCPSGSCDGNDIWGWEDPLNGNKIAIVGTTRGTSVLSTNLIYLQYNK